MLNKDLKDKTLAELNSLFKQYQAKEFLAGVAFSWIQAKGISSIDEMTNVSKEFREKLKQDGYFISELKQKGKHVDPDGTVKYVFNLLDSKRIESVLLDDKGRLTLCISSQVGCKMGCAFCATGALRFSRDLSSAEIVDQVIQIEKDSGLKINNLVYMGMGEPLDNYDNVLRSIRILNDPKGKQIGARHITISTCGIIPGIKRLAKEDLQIRLAISLHAATDAIREKIMSIDKKYPVSELIQAVREYQKVTGRRVTFEYVLLKDVNDSRQHARSLLKLINGIHTNINLLEYNEHNSADFKASDRKTIKDFRWILEDRGFEVNLRFKRGKEIKAACGQLGSSS